MSDFLKMCNTVVSSLFKKSTCEMYPHQPARVYKNTRGHVKLDESKCILCTLCDKTCPTNAIKVDRAKGTWEIDPFKCIQCNECVHCCRPGCLTMEASYTAPAVQKGTILINVPKPEPKVKPAPKAAAKPEAAAPKAEAKPKVEEKKETPAKEVKAEKPSEKKVEAPKEAKAEEKK